MSALFETDCPKANAYIDAAMKVAGVGVLAFMVSQYEKTQEYEECAIICKAINALMEGIDPPHGGFVWGKPLQKWLQRHVHGKYYTDGSILIENMPRYAEMVEKRVYPK